MDRRTFLAAAPFAGVALAQPESKNMSNPNVLSTPKQRLGGTLDLYVNADSGNNANNGWSASSPKQTLQNAYEYGRSEFDMNGFGMRINMAHATAKYAPIDAVGHLVGAHIFHVIGDNANPAACVIESTNGQPCVVAQDYAGLILSGVKLIGNGSGISVRQFGLVDYEHIHFGQMSSGSHVIIADLGVVSGVGPETIVGGAVAHWNCAGMSRLNLPQAVTIPNAVNFSYFLLAQSNSVVTGGTTFSGAGVGGCTGQQYLAQIVSCVVTGNSFPGNGGGAASYGAIKL